MTYCVGICVQAGLVFASDSRTNAGVDSVSEYSKMYSFGRPGDRQFIICAAGNLATTQGVITKIERDIRDSIEPNLMTVTSVTDAADYIGQISVEQQALNTGGGPAFEASFLLGGEILGAKLRLYLVYPAGNHIETSSRTPFLQIGESKYGKPILDRVIMMKTELEEATLCALVSMESTIRSNLTVGPPVEVQVYRAGSLEPGQYTSFTGDSRYWRTLRKSWNAEVREAFRRLPRVDWLEVDPQ
jgi:putative proteasome-type protease